MSLIDEALKRARLEAAQRAAESEGLPYPSIPRHLAPPRRRRWLPPAAVTLAVIGGLAVGVLLATRGGPQPDRVAAKGGNSAAQPQTTGATTARVRVGEPSPVAADPAAPRGAPANVPPAAEPASLVAATAAPTAARPVTPDPAAAAETLPDPAAPPAPRAAPERPRPSRAESLAEPRPPAASETAPDEAPVTPPRSAAEAATPPRRAPALANPPPRSAAERATPAEPASGLPERPAPPAPPASQTEPAPTAPPQPAVAPPEAPGAATAVTDPDSGMLLVLPQREQAPPAGGPAETALESHVQKFPLAGGGAIELGGIAWSETGPFALINGRVVGPGSMIGDYKLERIQPGHVELTGEGRRIHLSLQ